MAQPSPTDLYRRATTDALAVAEGVRPDQLDLPTPCTEWTVQDLLDHLVGGTHYLTLRLAGTEPAAPTRSTAGGLPMPASTPACPVSPSPAHSTGPAAPRSASTGRSSRPRRARSWTSSSTRGTSPPPPARTRPRSRARRRVHRHVPARHARAGRAGGHRRPRGHRGRRRHRPGSAARRDGTPAVTDRRTDRTDPAGLLATPGAGRCSASPGTPSEPPPSSPTMPACPGRRPASTSSCCATPGSSRARRRQPPPLPGRPRAARHARRVPRRLLGDPLGTPQGRPPRSRTATAGTASDSA